MKNPAIYEEKKMDKYNYVALLCSALLLAYQGVTEQHAIKNQAVRRVVYVLLGLSALYMGSRRDYYLPFLGDCVFPAGVMVNESQPAEATAFVEVKVPPKAHVVYWAAEPGTKLTLPWTAYKKYANSGTTTANIEGKATLRVRRPQAYFKPGLYKKVLQPHVHYRYQLTGGMYSRIYTTYL